MRQIRRGSSTVTVAPEGSFSRATLNDAPAGLCTSLPPMTRCWFRGPVSPQGGRHAQLAAGPAVGGASPDRAQAVLGGPAATTSPWCDQPASRARTRAQTRRPTHAPWRLPAYALSRIADAGLTPLLGRLVRHDHVHLDVVVNGRKVTVPAGVGLAEPVDGGPCPAGSQLQGDCVTHHIYAAAVANSPLHTHSASGLIHVEPDRPGTYTLGQFFDEWGVRLDSRCIGGYCAGKGKELRAYLDGHRIGGDPRRIVLGNRQEIALIFGSQGDFADIPTYRGGWPGLGCGGKGEPSC